MTHFKFRHDFSSGRLSVAVIQRSCVASVRRLKLDQESRVEAAENVKVNLRWCFILNLV